MTKSMDTNSINVLILISIHKAGCALSFLGSAFQHFTPFCSTPSK